MDYSTPEKRKSKCDKRAKKRYNVYKKGGGKRARDRNKKKEQ